MIAQKQENQDKVTDLVKDTFITSQSDSDNMIFNKNYYKSNKEVIACFQNILNFF